MCYFEPCICKTTFYPVSSGNVGMTAWSVEKKSLAQMLKKEGSKTKYAGVCG
jgi:hypothetical protein